MIGILIVTHSRLGEALIDAALADGDAARLKALRRERHRLNRRIRAHVVVDK